MARTKKKTNSGSGCGTLLGIYLVLIIIGAILSAFLDTVRYIPYGFGRCIPFLLLIIIIFCCYRIIFRATHRKPLTYEQVVALANSRAQKYINDTYNFKKGPVPVNPIFKSNLDVSGRWYEIEEPIDTFPAYISALLEGKHHEWVVVAIERNGLVCSMWTNKGDNNQSVSLNCDLADIIRKCKLIGGYSVLRFHNHPNPDPRHLTTLLASEQDKISANSCSEIICKEGINWFDFICARGEFLQFFSKVSDTFEVPGNGISDIIDVIGITPDMDYQLQKELYRNRFSLKKKAVLVGVAIMLCIFFAVGKMNYVNVSSDDSSKPFETNDQIQITDTIDYSNAESFEKALNDGQDLTGKVVQFIPTEIKPNSGVGYNIWAGEHLNFLSDGDQGIKVSDTVVVRTTNIQRSIGSWFIHYNIISINGVPYSQQDSQIGDSTEAVESKPSIPVSISQDGIDYNYDPVLEGYVVTSAYESDEITIPADIQGIPVVAIGEKAFYEHGTLKKINLPNTIVEIRQEAFGWCKALETFTFPEQVTIVSKMLFWNCPSLTEVIFNDSITAIDDNAFYDCSFTSLTLPASLKSIGEKAFEQCRGLNSITIPEGVTSIGRKAFIWCEGLKTISLPDTLTTIGGGCFRNCEKLESIVIPPNVESLNWETFVYCNSMITIKVPSSCKISLMADNKFNSCNANVIIY